MITVQIIFPGKCSEDQLDSIIERLFALHCEIFEGVNKKAFAHYVVHSRADWTKIRVFKSKDAWVGYLAVHYFNVRTDGRELVVFRGETGLLREYRKQVNMTK